MKLVNLRMKAIKHFITLLTTISMLTSCSTKESGNSPLPPRMQFCEVGSNLDGYDDTKFEFIDLEKLSTNFYNEGSVYPVSFADFKGFFIYNQIFVVDAKTLKNIPTSQALEFNIEDKVFILFKRQIKSKKGNLFNLYVYPKRFDQQKFSNITINSYDHTGTFIAISFMYASSEGLEMITPDLRRCGEKKFLYLFQ